MLFWISDQDILRKLTQNIASAELIHDKSNPLGSALFFLLVNQKLTTVNLFKINKNKVHADFFSLDFSVVENINKAIKNAYSLIRKRDFETAVIIFTLIKHYSEAVNICVKVYRPLLIESTRLSKGSTDIKAVQ